MKIEAEAEQILKTTQLRESSGKQRQMTAEELLTISQKDFLAKVWVSQQNMNKAGQAFSSDPDVREVAFVVTKEAMWKTIEAFRNKALLHRKVDQISQSKRAFSLLTRSPEITTKIDEMNEHLSKCMTLLKSISLDASWNVQKEVFFEGYEAKRIAVWEECVKLTEKYNVSLVEKNECDARIKAAPSQKDLDTQLRLTQTIESISEQFRRIVLITPNGKECKEITLEEFQNMKQKDFISRLRIVEISELNKDEVEVLWNNFITDRNGYILAKKKAAVAISSLNLSGSELRERAIKKIKEIKDQFETIMLINPSDANRTQALTLMEFQQIDREDFFRRLVIAEADVNTDAEKLAQWKKIIKMREEYSAAQYAFEHNKEVIEYQCLFKLLQMYSHKQLYEEGIHLIESKKKFEENPNLEGSLEIIMS